MSIGRRIKEARLNRGLSQEALARLVGVSKGTIGNYEIDLSNPNEKTLIALMDCLKVDANFLYQDEMSDDMRIRAFGSTDGCFLWGQPILTAYASAIRPTQEAACAVLGIPHVAVASQAAGTRSIPGGCVLLAQPLVGARREPER